MRRPERVGRRYSAKADLLWSDMVGVLEWLEALTADYQEREEAATPEDKVFLDIHALVAPLLSRIRAAEGDDHG